MASPLSLATSTKSAGCDLYSQLATTPPAASAAARFEAGGGTVRQEIRVTISITESFIPNWEYWLAVVLVMVGMIKHGHQWWTAILGEPERRDARNKVKRDEKQRRASIRYCMHLAVDAQSHSPSDLPRGHELWIDPDQEGDTVLFFVAPATEGSDQCHICHLDNAVYYAADRIKAYNIERVVSASPLQPGPMVEIHKARATIYKGDKHEYYRLRKDVFEANRYIDHLAQGLKRLPWNRPPAGDKRGRAT